MLTTLSSALTSSAFDMHPGWSGGPGFGWLFLVIPLFWITVFVLLFAFVGRRWRRSSPPWAMAHSTGRSAEATLAQRFAQGDIDETEYRARLEVIRTNNPDPRRD
ncbi:SHOCT domain-containing protein [Mycetocola zhadangensis]|uniref:SHOCT domain-containing protein n=1 Tax=Mycetocola zhadangensis TaxID=1164595 RepID=UPI003A4D49CD